MRGRKVLTLVFAVFLLAGAAGASAAKKVAFEGKVIRNVVYVKRGLQRLGMTIYVPAGEPKDLPTVMVIHGGGFVGGTRRMMDPLCMTIANQGMVVFNVEYRLTPYITFPAPIEDVRCGLRWIAKHAPEYGGDPSRLGVTGESAGGYLSSMTIFPAPDMFNDESCPEGAAEAPAVKAGVLYYGVYDMIKSYDLKYPNIRFLYFLAMRKKPSQDPELFRKVSPVTYLHSGLPPILIQAGDEDPLFPESRDLYDLLKRMGEPVEFQVYPGAGHGFAVFIKRPPGLVNLQKTAEFFREHL